MCKYKAVNPSQGTRISSLEPKINKKLEIHTNSKMVEPPLKDTLIMGTLGQGQPNLRVLSISINQNPELNPLGREKQSWVPSPGPT